MRKFGVAIVMAGVLAAAGSAMASTGSITRATVDPAWTQGSIAGSVTWTECQPSFSCKWFAYLTAQPSLPSYYCRGDELFDSDPDTRGIGGTDSQTANGSASFDFPNAGILYGVQGQRVCLSVIYDYWRQNPICIATAPVWGTNPADCPYEKVIATKVLSSSLLTVATPPSAPPQIPASATTPSGHSRRPHCPKGKHLVHRHGKIRCVKDGRGGHHQ